MNQTQFNRKRQGRYITRLPVSALIYICDNDHGWVGWCPLNNQWCAAAWDLGYQMFPTLRQALRTIKWHNGVQAGKHVADQPTRFREVFHIGGLVYRLSGSDQEFKGQQMRYSPRDERPLSFLK